MVRVPSGFAPHSPRAKAALCYTVPLVPSLYLLVHEARDRFVRLHAAQSLVFHALVGAAQLVLFGAVIFLGGVIQSMTGALIAAAVLFALFAVQLIVVAITWAHLVADCIRGRVALLPLVGEWVLWVEALTAREVWAQRRSRRGPPARSAPLSDTPPPEG
jgi:uncharacterized membrane protein